MPPVASAACCRNTVSPASFKMSIEMWRRWQAKMLFMIGMYWDARSPDTERIRMREVRPAVEEVWSVDVTPLKVPAAEVVVLSVVEVVEGADRVALDMCVRAIVRAPAIIVDGVSERSVVEVEEIRERRLLVRACST